MLCECRLDREHAHLHVTLRAGQIKHGAAESLLAARRQSQTWRENIGPHEAALVRFMIINLTMDIQDPDLL